MDQKNFKCPQCGEMIEISKALLHDLESEIHVRYEQKLREVQSRAEKEVSEKVSALENRLKKEQALYEEKERQHELRLKEERVKLLDKARREAEEASKAEVDDLRSELSNKEKELGKARQEELSLRKKQRELEEKERALELEMERRLHAESVKIQDKVAHDVEERYRFRDAEKDKRLADMSRQIDDLKRKAEQGSQQLQGEVLEIELENSLRDQFPFDEIEPVGKGIRGGDILHTIKTQRGTVCGKILWETKRTRNWNDSWLQKLKDDQRECKASIAVLVSETLPPGFHHFRQLDGVWVTDIPSAISLGEALRVILIQVTKTQEAQTGKSEKMELIYNYMMGPEFRSRVEGIVEAFKCLRDDLEAEKRAMQRIWERRGKQIERAICNTAGMYGDIEGIAGSILPGIKVLELPGSGGPED